MSFRLIAMKNKLFVILFTCLCLCFPMTRISAVGASASASQADGSETFYIQLVSESRPNQSLQASAKVVVGREFVAITGISDNYAASINRMRFPSLLDGLNRLSVNGWRLVSTNSFESPGMLVNVWTLSKTVTERAELLDGLGSTSKE